MELPEDKMSYAKFFRTIKRHKRRHYTKGEILKCKRCKGKILYVEATISIHYNLFGDQCSGGGEVFLIQLPYCPKCEGLPKKRQGCIHKYDKK